MTISKFESILAYFCSPVLLGEKMSNLVSISKLENFAIEKAVDLYNEKFEKFKIRLKTICECGSRMLILVYNEESLGKHLIEDERITQLLSIFGYKKSKSLGYYLNILSVRMKKYSFPHEIGIFLGYPIEDVLGFIEHGGKNYKYSGYWKVYSDVDKALKLFDRYEKLRNFVMEKIELGCNLDLILSQFDNKLFIA